MNKEERRLLESIFIKDKGWHTVGKDAVVVIAEHTVNGYVDIWHEGIKANPWIVNPDYIIIKRYK